MARTRFHKFSINHADLKIGLRFRNEGDAADFSTDQKLAPDDTFIETYVAVVARQFMASGVQLSGPPQVSTDAAKSSQKNEAVFISQTRVDLPVTTQSFAAAKKVVTMFENQQKTGKKSRKQARPKQTAQQSRQHSGPAT